MRQDLRQLYDSLGAISSQELRCALGVALMEYSDLLDLSGEKERISNEMAIQFSKMKEHLTYVEKENGLLKKENLRLTEQLNLNRKEMFGRTSEKTADIIGTALADEVYEDPLCEDLVPGEKSENDSCYSIGSVENSNKHRNVKKKGKREKDISGVPKKTEFVLDVNELNEIYGSGNWRIFNWTKYEEYISVLIQIRLLNFCNSLTFFTQLTPFFNV